MVKLENFFSEKYIATGYILARNSILPLVLHRIELQQKVKQLKYHVGIQFLNSFVYNM